jgi:hypothetical protein
MQVIAQVNRVFQDRPGGLVDYPGLADPLRMALADVTAVDRYSARGFLSQQVGGVRAASESCRMYSLMALTGSIAMSAVPTHSSPAYGYTPTTTSLIGACPARSSTRCCETRWPPPTPPRPR